MDKNGVLTILDWNKGMAQYPLAGFGNLKNVEVHDNPGLVKITSRQILDTTVTPTALPGAMEVDELGNTYIATGHTGNGNVYMNGTDISGALSNLWDMEIFRDYLWVRHGSQLSAYGPITNAPQWFGSVLNGFDNNYFGKLIKGQDSFLYSGNGNYVAKLDPLTLGTPAVAPTFDTSPSGNTNLQALNILDGEYCTTLECLGKNIMVGVSGGVDYSSRTGSKIAKIYPWNRQLGTLGDPGLADLPVVFNENGLHAMIQYANELYIVAGITGNVYRSNGTSYQRIARIPYFNRDPSISMSVYVNAIAISSEGRLLIGTTGGGNSADFKHGVWEININDSKYPIVFKKTISTGGQGKTLPLAIGFLYQKGIQDLHIGWSENSATFGVDEGDSACYDNFGGSIESPMYAVGTFQEKKSFQHIEWTLAEPLVSGQNLRISWRPNARAAYTLIGAWGFVAATGIKGVAGSLSTVDKGLVVDAQFAQFLIELDQAVGTTAGYNVNLATVRLW